MKKDALLWRHQKTAHTDETEITDINTTSQAEKTKISLLRFRGNFEHNKVVLKRGYGEMIVGRRPASGGLYRANDFIPWPRCLIFILRADVEPHLQTGMNDGPIQGNIYNGYTSDANNAHFI